MRKATKRGTGPLRYAMYLRCSTDDQAEKDFTTIEVQREIASQHVAERGGTLTGEYVDEGKSGTNLSRPGWIRLLADALMCTPFFGPVAE